MRFIMDASGLRSDDHVRQTIDALGRNASSGGLFSGVASPWTIGAGAASAGLWHSPFRTPAFFGQPFVGGFATNPIGVSHSAYAAAAYPPALGAYGVQPGAYGVQPGAYGVQPGLGVPGYGALDPYAAQRNAYNYWPYGSVASLSPLALEIARQQYLTQAIAARQSVIEAMYRGGWGGGV